MAWAGCGAASASPVREPDRPRERGGETVGVPPPRCATYEGPSALGTVTAPHLTEISGLAASVAHPGVLYVHNDSGEPHARFFAIRGDGTVLAEYGLGAQPARDLEEIAIARAPDGASHLYLADIGDNDARAGRTPRASISILRVVEPDPTIHAGASEPPRLVLEPVEHFELRYPATPVDCEAFFIEPVSGDLYLLGKVEAGPAPVFVARAPLSSSEPNLLALVGTTVAAEDLGDSITASSLDASGTRLLVRTYRHALLFDRADGEAWPATLARAPVVLPRLHEPQGEAIGWLDASGTIVSITEGEAAPVQVLRPACR